MWEKQGLIFNVIGNQSWNKSHAQCPIIDKSTLNEKEWKIYYSTRDVKGRSRIGYILVEAGNPRNVLYVHNKPVLELGKLGTFDDCGQMPTSIVKTINGDLFLYYIGWTKKQTVPYSNAIGLAVSYDNGKTFRKHSGPILGQNSSEHYFTGTACVEYDYDIWHMFYLSCTEWLEIDGRMEPRYLIKHTISDDGINWSYGDTAVDYKSGDELGICSATVIMDSYFPFKMWYCYRGKNYRKDIDDSYRIGYAEFDIRSTLSDRKRVELERMDDLSGIDISVSGWDSEMICYPNVFVYRDKLYMLYNGNGFGKTGIGYAVKENI